MQSNMRKNGRDTCSVMLEARCDSKRETVSLAIFYRAAPDNFRCFFRDQEHEKRERWK